MTGHPRAVVAAVIAGLGVAALWLWVSDLLAVVVLTLVALAVGTYLASGISSDWLGTRGRSFFDRHER